MKSHVLKPMYAVGIMSGTSLDGIDAVLIRRERNGTIKRIAFSHVDYPLPWKHYLHEIESQNRLRESHYFGAVWAEAAAELVSKLLRKARVAPSRVSVIGAHGQTVVHLPKPRTVLGRKVALTIQLFDTSRLAALCAIPVVGNFRAADIAVGGQGAPLVPHTHQMLFARKGAIVAVHNLGGIGNLTLLQGTRARLAFDTGPGNTWIDTTAHWLSGGRLSMDRNGACARRGVPNEFIVEKLLEHPYFKKPPPKSTGWEEFGPRVLSKFRTKLRRLGLKDALATVTEATARATAQSYRRWILPQYKLRNIIFCGGGAYNRNLLDRIRRNLPGIEIETTDAYGISPSEVEAIAFAILGLEFLKGNPSNVPQVTGARRAVVLGEMARPLNPTL